MKKDAVIKVIDRIVFWAFMAMALFITTSNSAVEIAFGMILLGALVRVFLKPPSAAQIRDFFNDRINLSLLIFFLLMGPSLFAAGDLAGKSFYAWTCKWGERVLLFYFARMFLDKKKTKAVLTMIVAVTFVTCLSGLWQQTTGTDFLRGFESVQADRFAAIRASFPYYNAFAAFLVTVFFIVGGFLMQARTRNVRIAFSVLLLMVMANLVLTYSRGGWVAFALTVVFSAMFFLKKKERAVIGFCLLLFVLGMFLIPAAQDRFLAIFRPGSDAGRFAIWGGALAMFKDAPLTGIGVGLFMDRLGDYSRLNAQYAHNNYLQILAETGILSLVAFVWFLWEMMAQGWRKLGKQRDMVLAGLFLGLVAFLIHSFFDVQLYSLRLSMMFWMLAGMLCVYTVKDSSTQGWTSQEA